MWQVTPAVAERSQDLWECLGFDHQQWSWNIHFWWMDGWQKNNRTTTMSRNPEVMPQSPSCYPIPMVGKQSWPPRALEFTSLTKDEVRNRSESTIEVWQYQQNMGVSVWVMMVIWCCCSKFLIGSRFCGNLALWPPIGRWRSSQCCGFAFAFGVWGGRPLVCR